jgi:pimeloyl-ACP methyl ester carboxylesterase
VVSMISRARRELHADSLPVIVAGHSIGAEVASWLVSHTAIPGLVGALLIAPGARGHLRVAVSDLTMSGEPEEPGSFSVAENIRAASPAIRFAIVRGTIAPPTARCSLPAVRASTNGRCRGADTR